jgi:uncharacterized membrane protein
MLIGVGALAIAAILCIVAWMAMRKRKEEYERGE